MSEGHSTTLATPDKPTNCSYNHPNCPQNGHPAPAGMSDRQSARTGGASGRRAAHGGGGLP